MTAERKYALTRVKAGDYLLLSNDGKTVWRIATYHEDGSAVTSDGRTLAGRFWGTWKYKGRVAAAAIDPNEWNDFEMYDCLFRSRRDAVDAVVDRS